ncbi:MAG: LapA family protein [Gammaproteobacteria bacterium]|jgi:lipopolysaccharide assembly protein A|nr:LapA family protein [Gammaproteobacteria bacterium]MBU1848819.1 LapA family protein [Gammaproteobacteria bacterium]
MAALNWILRAAVFLLLLGLAARNSDQVTVRFFFGYEWRIEQSVLLLVIFFLGALFGVLAGWSFARNRPAAPVPVDGERIRTD